MAWEIPGEGTVPLSDSRSISDGVCKTRQRLASVHSLKTCHVVMYRLLAIKQQRR